MGVNSCNTAFLALKTYIAQSVISSISEKYDPLYDKGEFEDLIDDK